MNRKEFYELISPIALQRKIELERLIACPKDKNNKFMKELLELNTQIYLISKHLQ